MSIRWVRQRRGGETISRDMLRITFRDWFGLQDNQAELLVVLWEQRGEPLHRRELCQAVNKHRPLNGGALHERIRVLRGAMEAEAVDFDEDRGYSLTEVGMGECEKAVQAMGVTMLGFCPLTPIVEPSDIIDTRSDTLRRAMGDPA